MKKTITISFMCFLLLGFIEQSNGQKLSNQQKMKIERQVDSIFLSLVKAAENLDYDEISKGVDDRYQAGFIINGSYYSKYDSLINLLKTNLRSGAKQSITIKNKKITVLSDNIVLLTASGDAGVDLNNGQSYSVNFFWSFVYEKIKDDWRVIQSHQSVNR